MPTACKPTHAGRFFMKRYALDCDDANALARHPKQRTIIKAADAFSATRSAARTSPLTRGFLLDKMAATPTGLGRPRRRRRRR